MPKLSQQSRSLAGDVFQYAELDQLGEYLTGIRAPAQLESAANDDPLYLNLLDRAKAISLAPPFTPGTVLGNYALLDRIGAGGMGQVFKAHHQTMKRTVALKVVAPQLLPSADMRSRFQREIETAGKLAHPNIVTAFDAGDDDGRCYLVMEFVDGSDLASNVVKNGPLPVAKAVNYVLQAARGLAHAHAAGIVHRDIKPANLLLDRSGTIKITDLGLARLTQDQSANSTALTNGRLVLGTAAFMAPEQAENPTGTDCRADIYSLGCTSYFLLTGKPPYEAATPLEVLYRHRHHPLPSLQAARPDCPLELDVLLQQMMAKNPDDRPRDLNRVVVKLEQLDAQCEAPAAISTEDTKRQLLRTPRYLFAVAASVLLLIALPAGLLIAQRTGVFSFGGEENKPQVIAPGVPATAKTAIQMVSIPAGEFKMGASAGDGFALNDEKTQRTVRISQPFSLSKFEITQRQYAEVMKTNPSAFRLGGRYAQRIKDVDSDYLPVESVSWTDAVTFCNRLSEREGLKPYYKVEGQTVTVAGGTGYRLPTEAEWEYACRAGTDTLWHFGSNPNKIDAFAWHAGNANGRTHAVGGKKANAFGLHDMHGNVPEWCWDRYHPEALKTNPQIDPVGPGRGKGIGRVFRGGGWNFDAARAHSSARNSLGVAYGPGNINLVGIRVARNVPISP